MQQTEVDTILTAIREFFNEIFIPVAMLIVTVVLVGYGIVNAVKYVKADSDEGKQKAKKNIIGVVIGAAVSVASIWLIPLLINLFAGQLHTGIDPVDTTSCIGFASMLPTMISTWLF